MVDPPTGGEKGNGRKLYKFLEFFEELRNSK
jgi:hypothetical protein